MLAPEPELKFTRELMFVALPAPIRCNFDVGLAVPTPTFPFLSTMNEVAVEEPMTNAVSPPVELIESLANGVVVERPMFPVN